MSEYTGRNASIERVWEDVAGKPYYSGRSYTTAHGENSTVLITSGENPSVVKIYADGDDESRKRACLESFIVGALAECAEPAPVAVPVVEDCQATRRPYYATYSYVPGTIINREQIRRFSSTEQAQFGSGIGRFVAWLEVAIPLETYEELHHLAPAKLPGREQYLEGRKFQQLYGSMKMVDAGFRRILGGLWAYNNALRTTGELTPTLVGHDDLHPGNLTFTQTEEGWRLHGIFDFGLAKPSTAERELRFLAPLGSRVIDAAIETYESESGRVVDRGLLAYWGVVQTMTTYASMLLHGSSQLYERHQDVLAIKEWLEQQSLVQQNS